jgi:hypothetical protein
MSADVVAESLSTTNPIKLGQDGRIRCKIPDVACSCADGTCENATLELRLCPLCGARAAAFVCSMRGCPVNGGAAHA